MTIRLKTAQGIKSFTNEHAAMLGYLKAPDAWVKTVYKFPLKLRIKAFFYRLYVRLRFSIPSGEMWWSQDDGFNDTVESTSIGWTGDGRPTPSIGKNTTCHQDTDAFEPSMPVFNFSESSEQQEALAKLISLARRLSGTAESVLDASQGLNDLFLQSIQPAQPTEISTVRQAPAGQKVTCTFPMPLATAYPATRKLKATAASGASRGSRRGT
jgi:hypothetical protein